MAWQGMAWQGVVIIGLALVGPFTGAVLRAGYKAPGTLCGSGAVWQSESECPSTDSRAHTDTTGTTDCGSRTASGAGRRVTDGPYSLLALG
jgi:hypothetical protein